MAARDLAKTRSGRIARGSRGRLLGTRPARDPRRSCNRFAIRVAALPWYFGAMPIENPFQDPLRFERRVPECTVVIFGANGDLTKRKLLPALYRLAYDRRLSAGFAVVGISRTPMTDEAFREKMLEAIKQFSEDTDFDEN